MLSMGTMFSFRSLERMRPLLMRIIRSAMGAMAWLWVMIITVVPRALLRSYRSFNTALPVT